MGLMLQLPLVVVAVERRLRLTGLSPGLVRVLQLLVLPLPAQRVVLVARLVAALLALLVERILVTVVVVVPPQVAQVALVAPV